MKKKLVVCILCGMMAMSALTCGIGSVFAAESPETPVISAQDMYDAVTEEYEDTDIVIMTAAVADYRPAEVSTEKVKKKDCDMSIPLTRTKDILATLGASKTHQFLCGFSMETQNLLENSRA